MSSHQLLSLFHVAIVGPLFYYVATATTIPAFLFPVLLGLGVVLALYQGYKAIAKLMASAPGYKINLFHVAIVAPLLIYIGYTKPDTSDFAYQLLLMLAFAVIGYHGYWLLRGE